MIQRNDLNQIILTDKSNTSLLIGQLVHYYPEDSFLQINPNDFEELRVMDKDEEIEQLKNLLRAESDNVENLKQLLTQAQQQYLEALKR